VTGVEPFRESAGGPTALLLITTFDIGGAERVYVDLANGLARRGYRVIAAALQTRSGDVARALAGSGVATVGLGMRGKFDAGVVPRLVRLLRRERVDVLYTFLIHAHLVGRIAGRLARTPVVLSSQQIMAWEGATIERLNRATARWCTAVVGVSQNVSRYLIDRVGIPSQKVVTFYNCVDVSAFCAPRRAKAAGEPPILGSIARLNPEKDHTSLLRAFAMLRARHPGARLLLAGGGPERQRLERLAASLEIADAVDFLGHVDDVRSVHARLDVYVQSSHVEGMPVAVLEALAAGIPVVAARVGGNEEAVVDGVGGLLVPPGNPEALAAAVGRLVEQPALAREMGLAGRRHVQQLFGADAMADATDALMRRLLAQRAPGEER
jgi:glycosyltransferase involved in cell wall biosynthesis